jgi:hypothetical protein
MFCFLLTVQYTKTIETQVNVFGDANWANWMTTGGYFEGTTENKPGSFARLAWHGLAGCPRSWELNSPPCGPRLHLASKVTTDGI